MTASELVFDRLKGEEGTREFCYDDATGLRVKAPVGNLTWGIGFNLDVCGSSGLFDVMLRYLIEQILAQIQNYPWYTAGNPVRQSVFLDLAYNMGARNLLGFVSCLHYASVGNWQCAADQLLDSQAARQLPNRYKPLAALLVSG